MNYELMESYIRLKMLKVGDKVTEQTLSDISYFLGSEPLPGPTKFEIHFDKTGQAHTLHDEIEIKNNRSGNKGES